MASALALAVIAGLLLALVAWLAQGAVLARAVQPPPPGALPAVSILKPLKGADPALAENVASFLRLRGVEHEVVFAVAHADDDALAVVRRVLREEGVGPDRARVVVSSRSVGMNRKVDNLANAAAEARYDWLLVSDSNVRVEPDHLLHVMTPAGQGASLVSMLVRGCGESGGGGALEAYQLNTFVMGGLAAWSSVFRRPAVMGKSMLLSRQTLASFGGFEHLGRFLAEDQVSGEEVAARGGRTVVAGPPVDNVLGRLSLADAARRHLRWALIRRHVAPFGYPGELLLNPVGIALVSCAARRDLASLRLAGLALLAMSLLGLTAERRLGVRRRPWLYPMLESARSAAALVLWPVPYFSSRVAWRGNQFRVTRRSRLVPEPARRPLVLPLTPPLPAVPSERTA